MGRKARLKRQRKEERDRPFRQMAEQIYLSGDRILDKSGNPIQFTSVEEIEKYIRESGQKNDVDLLQRKMNEVLMDFFCDNY